jgi:hypothetical protein
MPSVETFSSFLLFKRRGIHSPYRIQVITFLILIFITSFDCSKAQNLYIWPECYICEFYIIFTTHSHFISVQDYYI